MTISIATPPWSCLRVRLAPYCGIGPSSRTKPSWYDGPVSLRDSRLSRSLLGSEWLTFPWSPSLRQRTLRLPVCCLEQRLCCCYLAQRKELAGQRSPRPACAGKHLSHDSAAVAPVPSLPAGHVLKIDSKLRQGRGSAKDTACSL